MTSTRHLFFLVIPAKAGIQFLISWDKKGNDKNWIPASAGLRRQDAEANIRAAAFNSGAGHGPKGELRTQRVMTS